MTLGINCDMGESFGLYRLDVEPRQVVVGEAEPADGCHGVEAGLTLGEGLAAFERRGGGR